MRLLIAMMKHETNTFSPVPTPLARFGPLHGDAAIRAYRGTGTGLGAYLDLAEQEGAEIILPIAAGASPWSGPNRASGVGTGEKVLVSCFIIAINRRMSEPPGLQGLCPAWTQAAIWLYV